jgi:glycosyltransferase involved in cell wall biosynthesis
MRWAALSQRRGTRAVDGCQAVLEIPSAPVMNIGAAEVDQALADRVTAPGKVLFLVENASVPRDRRVWMEAVTLAKAGYAVSVICPQEHMLKRHEWLEGVSIYRFPRPSLPGILGHLLEYAIALPLTFILTWVVLFREGFDVIHAANPPDFFYVIGRIFKLLGKKFIFDHHDLVPEACLVHWSGLSLRFTYPIAKWTERATFRTADVVISTNESYRRVAIERGHIDQKRTFVVRSAIRKTDFREGRARHELRRGRRYLVCYVGTIGPYDGLDLLLQAFRHIVVDRRRSDVQLTIVGDGDVRPSIVGLSAQLGLLDFVEFTGYLSDDRAIADYMVTSDVCVEPAPKNSFNDQCTMNKVIEYMAMGKPVVAFDLHEVRYTAQSAAIYVPSNDPIDFGEQILRLLELPEERRRMGAEGIRRFNEVLAWEHQREILLDAYVYLRGPSASSGEAQPPGSTDD